MYIAPLSRHSDKEMGRHCLKLPGTLLDVSILLEKKRFRSHDNKPGALRGFKLLEEDSLGQLEIKRGHGSSKVNYIVTWSPSFGQYWNIADISV